MKAALIELASGTDLSLRINDSKRAICVGVGIEAPSRYFALAAPLEDGSLDVGVISDGSGSVAVELVENRVFIGHDRQVSLISSFAQGAVSVGSLEGAFFEFLLDEDARQLLAIHELGLVALSYEGVVAWRYHGTDIVERWQHTGDQLKLDTMDGLSATINLATGRAH